MEKVSQMGHKNTQMDKICRILSNVMKIQGSSPRWTSASQIYVAQSTASFTYLT